MPRARHAKQASSSSLITHFDRRCWQLSQGQAGNPADGDPTPSGVSKPLLLLKLPAEKFSGWALLCRLDANLEDFGAMAMGADLEIALGIDILKDWKKTESAVKTQGDHKCQPTSGRAKAGSTPYNTNTLYQRASENCPVWRSLCVGSDGTSHLARRDLCRSDSRYRQIGLAGGTSLPQVSGCNR